MSLGLSPKSSIVLRTRGAFAYARATVSRIFALRYCSLWAGVCASSSGLAMPPERNVAMDATSPLRQHSLPALVQFQIPIPLARPLSPTHITLSLVLVGFALPRLTLEAD